MDNTSDLIWQRTGGDNWVFGRPIRGVIRQPLAEVYFNEGSFIYKWVWFVKGMDQRGEE